MNFIVAAVAALCGVLFGLGLVVSGMSDPRKVLGFLDLAGQWNPSLAFVMLGAIGAALGPFRLARKRSRAFCGAPMQLPQAKTVDRRLLAGAALFGIGWGLAGLCPGPAVVLLASGSGKAAVFVVAMLVGMAAFDRLTTK